MTRALYLDDAYRTGFASEVVAVDAPQRAVALAATAFYPGGGGQPCDHGALGGSRVEAVRRDPDGVIWHVVDGTLPTVGDEVEGEIDWERRFGLMRAHTALHLVNGLIWLDAGARVSGASMDPHGGRADFALASISQSFGRELEARVNEQVERSLAVSARLVPRAEADRDPSLLRSHANLIPRSIDPLRIIDIADLDRQACSGTHVRDTAEIGAIRVTGTKSKGRENKRVTIALVD